MNFCCSESQEVRERFLHLNSTIPYFIMFNHNQSGLYSQVQPRKYSVSIDEKTKRDLRRKRIAAVHNA